MAKSSIHIQPLKAGSESHNLRQKDLDYVRKDLTKFNANYGFDLKLSDLRAEQEKLYLEKIGQRMQKKTTPIREGVFLFEERHTNEDIVKMVNGIRKNFGIKPVQLSIHRDEGHYEHHTGQWVPNFHAHVVFDWQNKETGKTFKLGREELSKLQDYVAHSLGMERGQKSSKTHLNALQWKNKKEKENLLKNQEILKRQFSKERELKKSSEKTLTENRTLRAAEKMRQDPKFKKILEHFENQVKKEQKKGRKI